MKLADQWVLTVGKSMAACTISPPSSSSFSIGNCKVQIEGGDFSSEKSREHLIFSVSSAAKIKISASVNDVDQNEAAVDLQIADGCEPAIINRCSCSGLSVKRKDWQASCSSIKSKKVKGGHHANCNWGYDGESLG